MLSAGFALVAAAAAAPPPPPAPPLSGLCADTPAEIDGNPRVNSGDYVTWNQSGIAGHDYHDWANQTADFGGAHNVRPYCNAQSWCIGYTLKNDQSPFCQLPAATIGARFLRVPYAAAVALNLQGLS
jgi:hypothetical protein